jgi:hypothetical protein
MLPNTTFPAAATVWTAVALVAAVPAVAAITTASMAALSSVCGSAAQTKQGEYRKGRYQESLFHKHSPAE